MPVTVTVQEAIKKSPPLLALITILGERDEAAPQSYTPGPFMVGEVLRRSEMAIFEAHNQAHNVLGLIEQQQNKDPSRLGPDMWRLSANGRDAYTWLVNQAATKPAVHGPVPAGGGKPSQGRPATAKVVKAAAAPVATSPAAGRARKPSQIKKAGGRR